MGQDGVIVVGAGPAGLVLATLLHRAGVPVTVVERQEQAELGRVPKAGAVEYRTVERLRAEGLVPDPLAFDVENHRCEFRSPDDAVVVDYGALTGSRPHFVYPQHQLVDVLAAALVGAGADVRFGRRIGSVEVGADTARVVCGDGEVLTGSAVVGADGANSVVAAAMDDLRTHERALPIRWLVIPAATPPLVRHTIYATHPRGYAAQLRRGERETRFYLEVPPDVPADAWPPERLAAELSERLREPGRLDGATFGEVAALDMRVRVRSPMQSGGAFLVGDAAHLITPAGGKGMNLAIADAVELAHGFIAAAAGDRTRLGAYSQTRLPAIWRTQAFSSWFLGVLSGDTDSMSQGLRGGWVSALRRDPLLARWFAHSYAGVDP